eukprot:scaffold250712_cov51-Attheya_sp.AAC.1
MTNHRHQDLPHPTTIEKPGDADNHANTRTVKLIIQGLPYFPVACNQVRKQCHLVAREQEITTNNKNCSLIVPVHPNYKHNNSPDGSFSQKEQRGSL